MTSIFYKLLEQLDDLEDKICINIEESEILKREVKDIREKLLVAENKLRKKKDK